MRDAGIQKDRGPPWTRMEWEWKCGCVVRSCPAQFSSEFSSGDREWSDVER